MREEGGGGAIARNTRNGKFVLIEETQSLTL